jgi:hypothetical protein
MTEPGKLPRRPGKPPAPGHAPASHKAHPPAASKPPAEPKKKLPVVWIAVGGIAAAILLVVVLIAAFSKSPPAPPPPEAKETAAAEKAKASARQAAQAEARRKEAEAAAKTAAELETQEKPVLELIEWANFKGAAAALRDLPKAVQDRVRPKFAAAVAAKYDVMLRDAKGMAERNKLDDARAHLLQIAQWDLPELAERAKTDAAALKAPSFVPVVARQEPIVANPAPGPADPAPNPAAPEKKEPPKPASTPLSEPSLPEAPTAASTKVAGTGVTVAARPPRAGTYKPGGLPDEEKQKKQSELAAAARKEKSGAKKAAAAKRAEWLSKLEKEKSIYDVVTLVDKGDVDKRVDIVIVSAGFPKSDYQKVNRLADQLKNALLKVDPFQNYPDYINFHRVNVDDASVQAAKIRLNIMNDILTCDRRSALEYASVAPSVDLVVVLCNVKDVRATGGPPVITIDAALDMGRTFLHEMGHAFASLSDEYVDEGLAPGRPFEENPEDEWVTNVTAVNNPRKAKWHYWVPDVWPAPHEMNRLPPGHRVGTYEGAAYQSKGVYRPEEKCLMRTDDKYCVVCFEQVEKKFYRLIAPIDDARPRKPLVGAWLDDTVVLEADAIKTIASGGEQIGKFQGLWYVNSKPRSASSKELTTVMSLKASELGAGQHEAGLRVDFSNKRVRRDEGWLSSSAGWKIDILNHKKPKWEGPEKLQAKIGEAVSFELKIQSPDAAAFKIEVHDLPEGATYDNGRFAWTPSKAHQGGWRPRFVLTDGLRRIERTVEIAVLDTSEKNFEPIFSPMEAIVLSEGEKLELLLEVEDVDGDNLVFTATNLPEGAELDVYDGILRWKPGAHNAGRHPNIQIDVFDGRRHVKGVVEIHVEDAIKFEGPDKDPLYGLRNASSGTRGRSLDKLGSMAKCYQFLESARLLRDKSQDVRATALGHLKDLLGNADGAFVSMMIKDIAPHAWHFTDHKEILSWLDQLASKGETNAPEVKTLRTALKGIEKYNKDRGF